MANASQPVHRRYLPVECEPCIARRQILIGNPSSVHAPTPQDSLPLPRLSTHDAQPLLRPARRLGLAQRRRQSRHATSNVATTQHGQARSAPTPARLRSLPRLQQARLPHARPRSWTTSCRSTSVPTGAWSSATPRSSAVTATDARRPTTCGKYGHRAGPLTPEQIANRQQANQLAEPPRTTMHDECAEDRWGGSFSLGLGAEYQTRPETRNSAKLGRGGSEGLGVIHEG